MNPSSGDAIAKYALPGQTDVFSYVELEPWSPSFSRVVSTIENGKSLMTQIRMLEDVKSSIEGRGFSYRNDAEWVQGTSTMLRIGSLLLDILSKSFGVKRDLLSGLLISICQRSEMRLFSHPASLKLAEPLFPIYLSFLGRFWSYVKNQILKPADTRVRHQFCLESLAILYLRLPQARCSIIDGLVLHNGDHLQGVNASLLAEFDRIRSSPRSRVRQSQASMYNLLQHPPEFSLSGQNYDCFESVVTDQTASENLRQHFSHEPTYFLAFISELFRQLELCAVGAGRPIYSLIDSYSLIARQAFLSFVFLDLHGTTRSGQYRVQFADIAGFCRPDDLLILCIRSILYSTPIHDRVKVNTCLDVIDSMITAWAADDPVLVDPDAAVCTPLPPHFCYKDFYAAFKLLLSSEDFQILIKTLCFLHTHLPRFNGRKRYNVIQILLIDTFFFKLFLHWHRLVREAFHAILVFRVRRGTAYPVQRSNASSSYQKGFLSTVLGYITKPFSSSQDSQAIKDEDDQGSKTPLTSLERVMKDTKDRDACRLLDVCSFVLSRSRLDSEEEATDTMLWMNVLVHVKMIANGPVNQMRYSALAIEEFESMQEQALSLQMQHEPPLGPYECIVPVLSYDIRTSLNDAI